MKKQLSDRIIRFPKGNLFEGGPLGPLDPLGFAELPKRLPFGSRIAELLKRPPYRGRSAELLLRSMKSTDLKRVSGQNFGSKSRCFHPEIRISGWKLIKN
jgi:hypothetical protein